MIKLKSIWPVLLLSVLTLPATKPLFHPGFFTMHDDQQVVRLSQLDQALLDGQFPVRWVADLGFGYGYPLFNFYPPLVYYLGEIYHLLLKLSYIGAIKMVFATAFIGAALTMYLWAKHHFGRLAGVTAAAFYTYAPYHAVDAYVRGALAETFAFVWPPLILLSIDHLLSRNDLRVKRPGLPAGEAGIENNSIWIISLIFSYTALMLTHNLIVLPFTLILFLYLIFFGFVKPHNFKQNIKSIVLSLTLSLSLSTFFWLPALAEKKFTLVDNILLREKYSYSLHYVEPAQLWNSLWGYGGSAPPGEIDGFTLKIGKLHLVLSTVAVLTSLTLMLVKKIRKKDQRKNLLLVTGYLLLSFSAFMTTKYSSAIWDNFPPLQYLQFPWRFLTFTALFSSFLAGGSIWLLQQIVKTKLVVNTLLVTGYLLLFIPNLKYFQPQHYLDVTDSHYTSDEFTKWIISKTSFEFVPKGVATRVGERSGVTEVDINQDQIAVLPYSSEPSVQVEIEKNLIQYKILRVNSPTPHQFQLNSFNFPGWQASIEGKSIPIIDQNPLKLITVNLPAGSYILEFHFTNTPIRSISNLISLISVLVIIGYLAYTKPYRK